MTKTSRAVLIKHQSGPAIPDDRVQDWSKERRHRKRAACFTRRCPVNRSTSAGAAEPRGRHVRYGGGADLKLRGSPIAATAAVGVSTPTPGMAATRTCR